LGEPAFLPGFTEAIRDPPPFDLLTHGFFDMVLVVIDMMFFG